MYTRATAATDGTREKKNVMHTAITIDSIQIRFEIFTQFCTTAEDDCTVKQRSRCCGKREWQRAWAQMYFLMIGPSWLPKSSQWNHSSNRMSSVGFPSTSTKYLNPSFSHMALSRSSTKPIVFACLCGECIILPGSRKICSRQEKLFFCALLWAHCRLIQTHRFEFGFGCGKSCACQCPQTMNAVTSLTSVGIELTSPSLMGMFRCLPFSTTFNSMSPFLMKNSCNQATNASNNKAKLQKWVRRKQALTKLFVSPSCTSLPPPFKMRVH